MRSRQVLGILIYLLTGAIGVLAFAYPFFTPVITVSEASAHSQDAPLLTAALVGISLVALLLELQGQSISAKTVAVLGVLVATISVLRLLEVAIPTPGGFSPIFAPIILAGYVFGARFGFLLGAFTLLISGLITGGVGPWLPYQMFATGWVGMSAGWLGTVTLALSRGKKRDSVIEVAALCTLGLIWGLLYGWIINLYFWPFVAGPIDQSWTPGTGPSAAIARYVMFYVTTSLVWDLARSIGNVVFILLLGRPLIRAFVRFQQRFHFTVRSAGA